MAAVTSNEDFAIDRLHLYWWNQTGRSVLGFASFQDALAHYRTTSPTFLNSIGGVIRGMAQDKVKAAWAKVAKDYPIGYPPVGAFYDSLATARQSFTAQDAKEVALDTAKDVAKAATFGLGGAALLAGLGTAIYLGITSGALARGVKGIGKKARVR